MVNVSTGIQDDEYIHVITGLSEGEEVITGPYSTLSKVLKNGTLLRKEDEKEKQDDK
jgi:HlyD family secretion protein